MGTHEDYHVLVLLLVGCFLPVQAEDGVVRTARYYYKELYAAGGLDPMADGHACFEDDLKNENFIIFGESKHLREYIVADGTFSKLPKASQQLLKKDFLIFRGYSKGVPWKEETFLDKDAGSWVSEQGILDKRTPFRVRFTINWQTLRYKWAVELLNMNSTYKGETATFGHCEEVQPGVQQHGEN